MLNPPAQDQRTSLGLLIIRVISGLAFIQHGWPKIQSPFTWMGPESNIPGFFQALGAFAEVGGGLAWILGLLTPLASLGLLCTMTVAMWTHISRGDPWISTGGPAWELAFAYFTVAALLLLAGPGRFSLDAALFRRRDADQPVGVSSAS